MHYSFSRASLSQRPNRTRRGGYVTTDTSEDDDLSLSGNYRVRLVVRDNHYEERPRNGLARPHVDNYTNVTTLGTGPCTLSG